MKRAPLPAVPVAFLAGLLRSRLTRSGEGQLVVELGDSTPCGQLSTAAARALGDSTVEIAYWSPETSRYLDIEDHAVVIPVVTAPER